MGQYYKTYNIDKKEVMSNDDMLKLMEHSYTCTTTSIQLRNLLTDLWSGQRIIHCGDYACHQIIKSYWGVHLYYILNENKVKNISEIDFTENDMYQLHGNCPAYSVPRYALNLDKKLWIDEEYSRPEWIFVDDIGVIHINRIDSLILLITAGNGLGSGDYSFEYPHAYYIGNWVGDRISCVWNKEDIPSDFKQFVPDFAEEYKSYCKELTKDTLKKMEHDLVKKTLNKDDFKKYFFNNIYCIFDDNAACDVLLDECPELDVVPSELRERMYDAYNFIITARNYNILDKRIIENFIKNYTLHVEGYINDYKDALLSPGNSYLSPAIRKLCAIKMEEAKEKILYKVPEKYKNGLLAYCAE